MYGGENGHKNLIWFSGLNEELQNFLNGHVVVVFLRYEVGKASSSQRGCIPTVFIAFALLHYITLRTRAFYQIHTKYTHTRRAPRSGWHRTPLTCHQKDGIPAEH